MRVAEWLVLRPRETGCIEGGRGRVVEMNQCVRNMRVVLGQNCASRERKLQEGSERIYKHKAELRSGVAGGKRDRGIRWGRRAGDVEGRVASYKSGRKWRV